MKQGHANRGMAFEALITAANERYRKAGEGIIVKVPTKFIPVRGKNGINGCFAREKSVVDFIGMYHGTPVAIEAKHTEQGRIRFDTVRQHQADFLTDWERKGGRAMVLVSFGMKEFFCIPWTAWSSGACLKWTGDNTLKVKPSAKPSDLLPCLKIEQGGEYILPYLHAELGREERERGLVMDAQRLAKNIRRCLGIRRTSDCLSCNKAFSENCLDTMLSASAACIENLTKERGNGWIPKQEMLPDEGEDVLAVDARFRQVFIAQRKSLPGWEVPVFVETGRGTVISVSHWMPLPEPPEGVD